MVESVRRAGVNYAARALNGRQIASGRIVTPPTGDPIVYRLTNPTMNYAWGSVDLIPALMGATPDGRPVAEVWMGAHPAAPSSVEVDGRAVHLDDYIADGPQNALGARAGAAPAAHLPFMLKLLAAAKALSLQVHPTRAQAVEGYERENAAGIALDDPARNYRDREHKPEMLWALTEFDMMCGFRPAAAIRALLTDLQVPELAPCVAALSAGEPAQAIEEALTLLLTASPEHQRVLTAGVVGAALAYPEPRPEYTLVRDLAHLYPGDIGIVASLFLNQLRIYPGESVFVGAGLVHSYVRGLGVELMAASDNVLRAGLTPKHVDVPELLHLVDFAPGEPQRLTPHPAGGALAYLPPIKDFALWTYRNEDADADAASPVLTGPAAGPRIALCCSGRATVTRAAEQLELSPGESLFIPDSDGPVTIAATGTLAIAYLP